jgi:D-alanyl-D-alanine carboxypeptidase/D-alanyl-D-alanine-endopeptidase (penicillin-binding protein 4)
MASLAIAGADGTMSDRLRRTELGGLVRAKTGTLNEVLSLAGYVQGPDGKLLAFAIIFNDTPQKAWRYRDAQDLIVYAIASLAK